MQAVSVEGDGSENGQQLLCKELSSLAEMLRLQSNAIHRMADSTMMMVECLMQQEETAESAKYLDGASVE